MNNIKPILFSGPMVRALLDGRKTQTRRVLKPQPPDGHRFVGIYGPGLTAVFEPLSRGDDYTVRLPYMPGDLLWVRERWSDDRLAPGEVYYYATALEDGLRADEVAEIRWKPSIHMPRWASRLTLEVTAVKVERLQEISDDDALAEGVTKVREHCYVIRGIDYDEIGLCHSGPIAPFAKLWDSINAKRGYGWDTNPLVSATSFIVHRMNIDDFLAQREAA